MEMIPVASSTIKAVGYDAQTQVLRVAFVSGGLYEYTGVGQDVVDEWNQAESAGKYFASNIKNRFPAQKVEEPVRKNEQELFIEQIADEIRANIVGDFGDVDVDFVIRKVSEAFYKGMSWKTSH